MEIKTKDLPKLITLYYSFTIEEIKKYEKIIDFYFLSQNENIKWDYHIVKKFEDLWYWSKLKENIGLFERVTLGLLFPDKAELKSCDCFRKENFCECSSAKPKNIKFTRAQSNEKNKQEYLALETIKYFFIPIINSNDVESILIHNKLPLKFHSLDISHKN